MTRKHYEAVAKALAASRPTERDGECFVQWLLTCAALAVEFEAINPRFNTDRFLAACDA